MTKSTQGRHQERQDPHWIEWLTGIASAILITGMIGWVAWEALTREATPPDLSIVVFATEKAASGYRVSFDVANAATTTAAAVSVVGRLLDGDRVVEEHQIIFDYVAAESKTSGAILFENNPSELKADIRPTGYADP